MSSVTHFEIYGDEPAKLADFHRNVFGRQVEQMRFLRSAVLPLAIDKPILRII